jgi:hypothetical protein
MNDEMFDGVAITDTFVLGWRHQVDQLVFVVEASLWPGHPNYDPPRSGEWTCYKLAQLVFSGVKSIDGLPNMNAVPTSTDDDGNSDFGTLAELVPEPGGYRITGDFGTVRVQADSLRLDISS